MNRFIEQEITPEAVQLFDSSRDLTVWLKDDVLTYSRHGSPARTSQAGRWIPEPQLTTLLASFEKSTAMARTIWFYPNREGCRGTFRAAGGKKWEEYEEGSLKSQFTELKRTTEFIELLHESEKFKIRLYADHCDTTLGQSDFTRDGAGSWITAAQLAKLKGQPEPTDPLPVSKPVTTYAFSGKGEARLLAASDLLNAGKPFCVEFWYRRSGDLSSPAGMLQLGDLNLVVAAPKAGNGALCKFYAGSSGMSWNSVKELLPDTQWHHLALFADAGKVYVHQDGKLYHAASIADLGIRELNPDSHFRSGPLSRWLAVRATGRPGE
jgi:hypothetical protein